MDPLVSPKSATSIGALVQTALNVRQQWSERHAHGTEIPKLKEQWEETEPFLETLVSWPRECRLATQT
jgi:hypothetical protein